ncbi:MAG TPA: GNAT family protein [Caulobacteraceae bacterium]|jgi:RimJ/RimL family protein N-acetyltransferase
MRLRCRTLFGRHIRLEPLVEAHREALRLACAADPEIWEIFPYSMLDEHFDGWWARMQDPGSEWMAFAVIAAEEVVGVTGFVPERAPGVAVIGMTYLRPEARGGPANPESKLLLLQHAFDGGARRVVFNVDPVNARSRAAMRKIGAVEEGVARKASVTWTGRVRDLVVFSVLDDEWPDLRRRLEARLAAFGAAGADS